MGHLRLNAADANSAPVMAKILCIDDEVDTLRTRKLLLESEGHQVLEAGTAAEGLRLLQTAAVDLVILDYWMSGMNGIAAAREIRRIKPTVPIIILSGFAELPGEAIGLADRWIMKGHSAEELLNTIRALV